MVLLLLNAHLLNLLNLLFAKSHSISDYSIICCKSRSSGSSNNEENRVLTGCTGVNAYNMVIKRNRKSDNLKKLPFELIKLITNDFSEELGRGAFGQVFKVKLINMKTMVVYMYVDKTNGAYSYLFTFFLFQIQLIRA